MLAVLRTGEGPPALRAPEVNGAVIDAARRRRGGDASPSRCRRRARASCSPAAASYCRRAPSCGHALDRYGHLLLWPGEDTYRVAEPGSLRALFGERRLDVAPVSRGRGHRRGRGSAAAQPPHAPHGSVDARRQGDARGRDAARRRRRRRARLPHAARPDERVALDGRVRERRAAAARRAAMDDAGGAHLRRDLDHPPLGPRRAGPGGPAGHARLRALAAAGLARRDAGAAERARRVSHQRRSRSRRRRRASTKTPPA